MKINRDSNPEYTVVTKSDEIYREIKKSSKARALQRRKSDFTNRFYKKSIVIPK